MRSGIYKHNKSDLVVNTFLQGFYGRNLEKHEVVAEFKCEGHNSSSVDSAVLAHEVPEGNKDSIRNCTRDHFG